MKVLNLALEWIYIQLLQQLLSSISCLFGRFNVNGLLLSCLTNSTVSVKYKNPNRQSISITPTHPSACVSVDGMHL